MSDYQPPVLNCTQGTLMLNNSKGKNVTSVSWNFNFTDNSLTENQPGITMDSFTVVLTIEKKEVDTKLPKLIGIGSNDVQYTVTDRAGKSSTCSFTVVVKGRWRLHVNHLTPRFFTERNRDRRKSRSQGDRPTPDYSGSQCEKECHFQIGLIGHT